MAKEEIKKLIEDSKKSLEQDHQKSSQSIKDDLQTFKKRHLIKFDPKKLS